METIVDMNWYGTRYSLSDIFIPIKKIQTNNEWLRVMNRNRDNSYILPMSVVKSAQKVYNGYELFYALHSSILDEVWFINKTSF